MEKQVLIIESDSSKKLKFSNSNLQVFDENNKIVLQHSCHKIFLVFVIGEYSITSVLVKHLKKFSVPVIFLNYNLRCYFSIVPDNRGNFLLREKQYGCSYDFSIAKKIIYNKMQNQLFLMKSLRYKTADEVEAIACLEALLAKVPFSRVSAELMGVEGNASKLFFETYFKNMGFTGRRPRCKTDIYNVLLDIGYTCLFNFVEANLELYGFDTYRGFFHKQFYQRKSLVCDVIEPFRCLIDRRVRKSYNLKQIDPDHFGFGNGQYYLKRAYSKKYSQLFLKEILSHKESIFLYVQSFYRAFIREKSLDDYPLFVLGDDR